MHDAMHLDQYWWAERCPDAVTRQRIVDVCPHDGIVIDKHNPEELHLHFEQCNQCGRCVQVAPAGGLKIDPVNFHTLQEACAISTAVTLSTFEPGEATHLTIATHITPLCDCFCFTSLPILPDAGVFGSDDIVAIDQAALDVIGRMRLIEENLPTVMEVHTRTGPPLSWVHGLLKDPYLVCAYGEKLGLGSRQYELVDVLPVKQFARGCDVYLSKVTTRSNS